MYREANESQKLSPVQKMVENLSNVFSSLNVFHFLGYIILIDNSLLYNWWTPVHLFSWKFFIVSN